MSITEEQLEEWERLAGAASSGPWRVEDDKFGVPLVKQTHGRATVADCDFANVDQNTAFIASAREAVPALVAEVRQLKSRLTTRNGIHPDDESRERETISQERDEARARIREMEQERLSLIEGSKGLAAERDRWKAQAEDVDEALAALDIAHARAEAAEKRVAELEAKHGK